MNRKPLVLVVMDGVGLTDKDNGNAVKHAYTPNLDALMATCPNTKIKAHGTAVGLPSDADMGNSEVGHNALGCGQIYSQGAKLVNESIETGAIYTSDTWKELIANAKGHTLHFLGLLSDGDGHYDAVSAFQKAIRGSDVDASLYYLERLIQAGDMDSIERRLLVIAYEDIGLGNPAAVARTISAIDAAKRVGFPEGMIPLGVAVIDLALSPKSKSGELAIQAAMAEAEASDPPVPAYLRFTPVGMKEEDKYPYDRPDLWHKIQYLPDAIRTKRFYQPQATSAYEKQLAANYESLKRYVRSKNLAELKRGK